MIITCPHCQTRYKVAADSISAAGRQVQCASCSEAWMATPSFPKAPDPLEDFEPTPDETAFSNDNDTLFSDADEALLDSRFTHNDPPQAPPPDPAPDETAETDHAHLPHDPKLAEERRSAMAKRRKKIDRAMPMARLRRSSRIIATVALACLLVVMVGFRTDIVRVFPEFGMAYEAVGLGTNVVGLDFSDVKTLRTTRDGIEVLMVTATMTNVTNRPAAVPPVLVSLVSAEDAVIYEWSVTPAERQVPRAGTIDLETQLTAPPLGIERVRLTFAYGQNRIEPSSTGGAGGNTVRDPMAGQEGAGILDRTEE